MGGDSPLASYLAPETLRLQVCLAAFEEKLKYVGYKTEGVRICAGGDTFRGYICPPVGLQVSCPTDLHVPEYVGLQLAAEAFSRSSCVCFIV